RLDSRQAQRECRPLAELTDNGDRTAHLLCQTLSDGQPQPGTNLAPAEDAIDLVELLEDVRQIFRRDADTGVLDFDLQVGPLRAQGNADVARRRELHRVLDEVQQ